MIRPAHQPLPPAGAKDPEGGPGGFNPAAPDGSYDLDMSNAGERAVAVALAEMDRAAAADLMKGILLDGKVSVAVCASVCMCMCRCACVCACVRECVCVLCGLCVGVGCSTCPSLFHWAHARLALSQSVPSAKKANWPAQVPVRGNLRFEFSSKKAQRGWVVMEDRK